MYTSGSPGRCLSPRPNRMQEVFGQHSQSHGANFGVVLCRDRSCTRRSLQVPSNAGHTVIPRGTPVRWCPSTWHTESHPLLPAPSSPRSPPDRRTAQSRQHGSHTHRQGQGRAPRQPPGMPPRAALRSRAARCKQRLQSHFTHPGPRKGQFARHEAPR